MLYPTLPLAQALNWRRGIFAIAALASLTGCGTPNGDFGEVRPTLVSDSIHDWVGPYASGAKKASKFDLTDDERQLRDLAYPLIDPPYDRQQWYSVAGEYGLYRPERQLDCAAYTNWLLTGDGPSPLARYGPKLEKTRHEATIFLSEHDRSPASRYARLMDDVRNDIAQVPQFFETGTRVVDIDQKRKKTLAYVSGVSPAERNNAELRVRENAAIIATVRNMLVRRTACYHYALGRLVIASPYTQARDVEHAIDRLKADIERYRMPAPTWTRGRNLASAR